MPDFIVYVNEVWIQAFRIKAQTKKEAIDLVADGQGHFIEGNSGLEFSHSLSKDDWEVEEDKTTKEGD